VRRLPLLEAEKLDQIHVERLSELFERPNGDRLGRLAFHRLDVLVANTGLFSQLLLREAGLHPQRLDPLSYLFLRLVLVSQACSVRTHQAPQSRALVNNNGKIPEQSAPPN